MLEDSDLNVQQLLSTKFDMRNRVVPKNYKSRLINYNYLRLVLDFTRMAVAFINAVIFSLLGSIHLYWVLGGTWGMHVAVPTNQAGNRLFDPSKVGTLIVAIGLFLFAWVNLGFIGYFNLGISSDYFKYALLLIAVIFTIRSIGDFRFVGFSKRFNASPFAKMDTAFFSPLCLILAILHGVLLILI